MHANFDVRYHAWVSLSRKGGQFPSGFRGLTEDIHMRGKSQQTGGHMEGWVSE